MASPKGALLYKVAFFFFLEGGGGGVRGGRNFRKVLSFFGDKTVPFPEI